MKTFFITPLIPYKIYLKIKQFKNIEIFNKDELKLINNLEILFDYSIQLTESIKNNIINIVNKIDTYKNTNYKDKLIFIRQNDYDEITYYNYLIFFLLLKRKYSQIIDTKNVKTITTSFGLSDIGPIPENVIKFNNLNKNDKTEYINNFIEHSNTKNDIPSNEIVLLCFKIKNIGLDSFDYNSDPEEIIRVLRGESLPSIKTVLLDAEKALVKAMQPKYNSILFKKYPESNDGLFKHKYKYISYSLSDPIVLKYDNGEIIGSSDYLDVDTIIIKDNKKFILQKHKTSTSIVNTWKT